jgi:hypothetical protein
MMEDREDEVIDEGLELVSNAALKALERAYKTGIADGASSRNAGEVVVSYHESEDELTAPVGSPDRIVTVNMRFTCQTIVPEGTYYLVKKGRV